MNGVDQIGKVIFKLFGFEYIRAAVKIIPDPANDKPVILAFGGVVSPGVIGKENTKMKKKVLAGLAIGVMVVGLATAGNATILTFDDHSNLGVTLGGGMMWTIFGGGHLFMQTWTNADLQKRQISNHARNGCI